MKSKPNEHRKAGRLLLALLCVSWLAASAAHAYGIRTVIVSPVPGNPTASGANLLAAIAGITTASATNPYLIKIEPGIYDVGATRFQMKEWVDIEGSGIDVTTIQGSGDVPPPPPTQPSYIGVVVGASHTEIRHLTIRAIGDKVNTLAIGMSLYDVLDQRIYRVRFQAEGGDAQWGVRADYSNLHAREIEVDLSTGGGTGNSYGIVVRGVPPADSTLLDSRIVVEGGLHGHGLYFADGGLFRDASRNSIKVTSMTSSAGIFYASTYVPTSPYVGNVEFRNFDIVSKSEGEGTGIVGAFGVYVVEDTDQSFVQSRINTYASAGPSIGIRCGNGTLGCRTRIDASEIVTATPGGPDEAVSGSFDTAIGASLIEGTVGFFSVCAGVYDLSYTLYAAPLCP